MRDLTITADQLTWFRLKRSGLIKPFSTAVEAASALGGVQAQILSAAGIALVNRVEGFTKSHLENLLLSDRALVKLWGQRFTLHLYSSIEWPVIQAAYARNRSWWRRSFCKNGGSEEDFEERVKMSADMLRERGLRGMCRADLRQLPMENSPELLSSWGGLFAELVQQGLACHGHRNGSESIFVHREHWLPDLDWQPPRQEQADLLLARRYLGSYGPAPAIDLAYWRGLSLSAVRDSLVSLGNEVVKLRCDGKALLCLRSDLDELLAPPPPRRHWPLLMLGRFDPVLLGHKDKTWICPRLYYNRVWRPAGHIEGTIIHLGKTIATWRYKLNGPGFEITVYPFKRLPGVVLPKIRTKAKNIARHFGIPPQKLKISLAEE